MDVSQRVPDNHFTRWRRPMAAIALALAGAAPAMAADLNVNPGLWEFTNTMRMEGPMEMPEQSSSETDCITQDDIDRGPLFGMEDDMDEACEILDEDISRDRVYYRLECAGGPDESFTMDYEMQLMGDTIRGEMSGDMDTPMGPMQMQIDFNGERVGDSC